MSRASWWLWSIFLALGTAPLWLGLALGVPLGSVAAWVGGRDWTVQAVVTGLVGVAALSAAVVTILTSRFVARSKATVDFLEKMESQTYYQERFLAYRRFRIGEVTTEALLAQKPSGKSTDRDLVWDYLNTWEFVAVCCRRRVFDRDMVIQFAYPSILRDWAFAAPLVRHVRQDGEDASPDIYEHLEWLATRCRRFEHRIRNASARSRR